ncbi:hypothetical protein PGT21_028685 [Puccinia graminis f. sp. tritici]|uniref:Uncharacterized protein n=1 Tax=Puccinia graminis f. sp. tritici TaxID=56615 RepID=A0A5B0N8J4_PUCGR|nr:hypothetical protein PGT21_028685 [Puccinia graminis f. sp. tritici]KAA1133012.1 hypothetical protein PGTUg99_022284 [Puccinia graminis f. sp. tritici]
MASATVLGASPNLPGSGESPLDTGALGNWNGLPFPSPVVIPSTPNGASATWSPNVIQAFGYSLSSRVIRE